MLLGDVRFYKVTTKMSFMAMDSFETLSKVGFLVNSDTIALPILRSDI